MNNPCRLLAAILLVAPGLPAFAGPAYDALADIVEQQAEPSQAPQAASVIKTEVDEVSLTVAVTDKNKMGVTDLDQSAFKVYEDNASQTIVSFRHDDAPVAIGLVIDGYCGKIALHQAVHEALLRFIETRNPNDQTFVIDSELSLLQDFTADNAAIRLAIGKVRVGGATSKLYDAMIASANHLRKSPLQRKVLIVVSEGHNVDSRRSLEDVLKNLQTPDAPTVYTIGLLDPRRRRGYDPYASYRDALAQPAESTGGMTFFPQNNSDAEDVASRISRDIHNQYVIDYLPSRPISAGGYRRIRVDVSVKHRDKLYARTRSGYLAAPK